MKIKRALAAESNSYSADTIRGWFNSKCPEVRAIAFNRLYEHEERCESLPEGERTEFIVNFLRECIVLDCDNDWRIGRFSALSYGNSLIVHDYANGRLDRGRRIVDLLGEVCHDGLTEMRRAVVDVVLEHVFQDEKLKDAFNSWRESPQLASIFAEADDMAQKWLQMYRERREGKNI
jgi:hypothetical protein